MALTKVPSNLDATVSTTQSASDNSTNVATTAYVTTAIANLSDSAPAALNTLNEIAAALGDDANYASTTTAAIAAKLPLAGGTLTGDLVLSGAPTSGLHPATKTYTDTADALKLNLSGGTLTGNLVVSTGSPQIQFQTGASHYNWQIAAQESVTTAFEISSGAQDADATNDTYTPRLVILQDGKVGIGTGTSSPAAGLHVVTAGGTTPFRVQGGANAGVNIMEVGYAGGGAGANFIVDDNGRVGIGTTSPDTPLHVNAAGSTASTNIQAGTVATFERSQSTAGAYVAIIGATNGASAVHFGDPDNDDIGNITYNHSENRMEFITNASERMRIHANGKVGFSANGMGNVSSIPRDFAFFTEGSTNGVEIRSNDQRLMMLGAGGSGGTASDDGYLTMSSQGTAKLWLSANGASVFNGGAVGINRTPSISGAKLEAGGADNVPLIAVEASGFHGGIGANGSTGKGRGLQIFAQGNIIATFNNQTNVGYVSDGLFATNARPNRINCTGSGQMLFGYTDSGSGLYSAAMGMEFDEINGLNQSQWVDGWVMKATSSGTKTLRIETDGDMYNVNGTYTSGSDRRIKKEISDASSQWDDVKAVRVRKFKLGATAPGSPHDHFHIGVIAQEIEEAGMNGLVKEMTPDDGHIRFNPSLAGDKIKTVKYSILQMKAFKALQEAMEKIETLEAKVAALEAE